MPEATPALPRAADTGQPQRTRAHRRRRDLIDALAFVAVAIDQLRCARCGGAEICAVAPGEIEDRTPLFLLRAEVLMQAWCSECWPASFAAARAA